MAALALSSIGAGPGAPDPAASPLGSWEVRAGTETSLYADTDHVTVVSPTIFGRAENPLSGWSFGGSYLVDVVSAASADIVATATPTWHEVRHAASASLGVKPGAFGGAVSFSASIEPDYVSLTGGGSLSWEILDKNVTLMLGYGYGSDVAGRKETPFEVFGLHLERHQINGGVSFTVDRATLATIVADAVLEAGDPSKPYRYVPMFAPGTGDAIPVGAPAALVNDERTQQRPREQLPLERDRFALTGRIAHRFATATVRAEERLYIDSWGLPASTTDASFVWDAARRLAIGPRGHLHVQGGTDFWRRAYELEERGGALRPPAIRTGDRELGPLFSVTGGLAADLDLSRSAGAGDRVLSLRADGIYTSYSDALYLVDRAALFTSLTFNATFE